MSYRLARFNRAEMAQPIQLTKRDRDIIRLVQQHRFLRSSHILALIDGSSQQILRRLQLLYHHGYLERPRAQLDYFLQGGGSRHIVYGLSSKGAELLNQQTDPPVQWINWGAKNRFVGRVFIDHSLLVSDIMVKIELACRADGHIRLISEDELMFRSNKRQLVKWKVALPNGTQIGIMPDRVFALEYSGDNKKWERAYFFLEADRGTMPVNRRNLNQTSFYRKLLAYQSTWSQAIHRIRFGFHRFRVLTVTSTPQRINSLRNACSKLKAGHGLFLFTDQAEFENAPDILSHQWQTARPGQTTTLLK
jgi:hypothetical protein